MNKVGSLNFGQQIVPVKLPKPMSEQEKQELSQAKSMFDENIGKDVIKFDMKDDSNIDVVINHPDPNMEKMLAAKMKEMTGASNQKQAPEVGGKLNAMA